MNNNKIFFAGLLLGAAAGATLALFLSSDKGKEMLAEAKESAGDLKEDLKDKVAGLDKELHALMKKGKDFLDELKGKTDNITS